MLIKSKYIKNVGLPFLFSRITLEIIGYLSSFLLPNPAYPSEILDRGWNFTRFLFLDIWGRWDSGWYFSIVSKGYTQNFDVSNTQSNIAFFPMYPLLIKIFSLFSIDFSIHKTAFVIFALLISNISFFISLIIIHKICEFFNFEDELIKSVIWLILLFPYSFFFSTIYSESVFILFFSLSIYFSIKSRWKLAIIWGALLSLTRPLGVFVAIPIGIRYLIDNKFKFKFKEVIFFTIIPISFLMFFLYAYQLTGDFLAPMHIQSAWGKIFIMPWQTLINPVVWIPIINKIDISITIIVISLLFVYVILKLPKIEWVFYSFIMIIMTLTSGQLVSMGRYTIVIIPIFLSLGKLIHKWEFLKIPVYVLFSMLQAVLFAGWCRFYFVG